MFKSDSIINTSIPGMKEFKPVRKSDAMKKSIDDQRDFIWLLKG